MIVSDPHDSFKQIVTPPPTDWTPAGATLYPVGKQNMEYLVFIVSYSHVSKLLLSSGFSRRLLEEEVSFSLPFTSSSPPPSPFTFVPRVSCAGGIPGLRLQE